MQIPGRRVTVPLGPASHRDSQLEVATKSKNSKGGSDNVTASSGFRGGDLVGGQAEPDLLICPICLRQFSGYPGMRSHMRRKHPDEYFAEYKAAANTTKHDWWSDIEIDKMARLELQLSDTVRFINLELARHMPGRSEEEIKGKRKAKNYRAVLERLAEESRPSQTTTDDSVHEISTATIPANADPGAGPCCCTEVGSDATLIWGSVPYYIDDMNSNPSLRPLPNEAEISLLYTALLTVVHDPEIAMELCDLYLTDVRGKDVGLVLARRVRPKSKERSTLVSKRKLKRKTML